MQRAFHTRGVCCPPALVVVEDRRLNCGLVRRSVGLDHPVLLHWSDDSSPTQFDHGSMALIRHVLNKWCSHDSGTGCSTRFSGGCDRDGGYDITPDAAFAAT